VWLESVYLGRAFGTDHEITVVLAPNGLIKVDATCGLPYDELAACPDAWPRVYMKRMIQTTLMHKLHRRPGWRFIPE